MNRLLITASKSVAPTLRINHAAPSSSAVRFLAARHFSDSTATDAEGIKVGTVKHFGYKSAFGFIIPDGLDKENYENSDLVFIHRSDIKAMNLPRNEKAFPSLNKGQRVQFKQRAADDGTQSSRAYDLTLEGGELVLPFNPGYLENFIKTSKARFGDEVFEIFSTSVDQKELETKIVAAYDKVKHNIEKQKEKVMRVSDMAGKPYEKKEES
mmetsp:Transcript_18780/g.40683  ORF Transcript_18780/g.40683 Transcript_18780/m.40683 type:complete len:211 (+) Transcript_18780:109-741(+)